MRRTCASLFYAVVLAAPLTSGCRGDDEPGTTEFVPPPTESADTVDSGGASPGRTGYHASFFVGDEQASVFWGGGSSAMAMFVNQTNGHLNPAGCFFGMVCVESLPTEGAPVARTWVDITGMTSIDADPVTVDGANLFLYDFFEPNFYYGTPFGFSGMGSIGFSGALVPFEADDLFVYPDPIRMTAPDVEAIIRVGPGDAIDLEWVTGGLGDVYLDDELLFHRLADDGAHTVQVDDLVLSGPIDSARLTVYRLNAVDVDGGGNDVNVVAATTQVYGVDYLDPGTVPELTVTDACADAAAMTSADPGSYWFDKRGFSDSVDPGSGNALTGREAPGADAFVRVDLLTGQQLTVALEYVSGDESLYLLTDPCDVGAGLVGADQESWYGPDEQIVWTATEDGPVYVVLDEYTGYAELGTVELYIQ